MRVAFALVVCALSLAACSGGDDVPARADEPTLLSSRGLYSDIARRQVVAGAFEYEPDFALWSDGADKRRWLILPPGSRVDVSDMAHWQFPVGAKLFKEFGHDGKLLETRLIERIKETGRIKEDYFMGTFVWRADQSDARLVTDGRSNVNRTEHDVPAQKFCIVCHRGEPGAVLGFSAVQLSASGTLQRAVRRKLLSEDPGREYPMPGDEVQRAALGMLNANCGHCHSESGMADFMHLRILPDEVDRPVEELDLYRSTVGVELSDEWEDHPAEFSMRIVPGDLEHSAIAYRMSQRGEDELVPDQMPPLATTKVDEDGLAAVQAWIASLPRAPADAGGEPEPHDAAVRDAEAEPEMDAATARDAAVLQDAAVEADAAADSGRVEPVDASVGTGPLGEQAGSEGTIGPTESGAAGNFGGEAGAGTDASVAMGADAAVASPDSGVTAGGAAGSAGSTEGSGAAGAAGVAGSTAGSGASGAAGSAGSTGGSGAAGAAGSAGSTGGSGAAGSAGSTAVPAGSGAAGSAGSAGSTAGGNANGAAGAIGIAGSTAVATDNGAAGATGIAGSTADANDGGASDTMVDAGSAGAGGTQPTHPRRRWWHRDHDADGGVAGSASAGDSSTAASEGDACTSEPP